MAKVDLIIGGNSYSVACRDGEEAHLVNIATLVDSKAQQAKKAVGGVNEVRQLLFASLFLADELDEARRKGGAPAAATHQGTAPSADDAQSVALMEDIATRLESLATRLEQRG
jgi:cell division protein ZapA